MDKELQIKTPDKKIIYATLRGSFKKPLVVMVHGLSGNRNEAMHYNAARYFEKHGFSSLRINLYSWEKGARRLHECTFSTHGKDIDTVLKYLNSKGAKDIYIVGHSYGWPSILHTSERNYKAVAGWDGSILPTNHVDVPMRIPKPKGRLLNEGYFVVIGEQMAKDSHRIKSLDLIKRFDKPISFITVDDNVNGNLGGNQKMYKVAKVEKELVVIKGAHHNFVEEGKEEELYAATVKWFKRFK
jgi:dienelactone hydrolase